MPVICIYYNIYMFGNTIKEKLGTTLIDVGCGKYISKEMAKFARDNGFNTYIGIDKILRMVPKVNGIQIIG